MTYQQPALEPVQPTPPSTPPARRKSNRTGNLLLAVAGIIAIGGIAFAVGRLTAPASSATSAGNGGFGQIPGATFNPGAFPGGQVGPLAGGLGGATLRGEVTAVSDDSITLQLENGSTIEVPIDDSTDYQAATEATPADVSVGRTILIESSGIAFNPGSGPGASFDPTGGQPQPSFGPAEQVIVLGD